jgi:hypothetical protein
MFPSSVGTLGGGSTRLFFLLGSLSKRGNECFGGRRPSGGIARIGNLVETMVHEVVVWRPSTGKDADAWLGWPGEAS